ncbi:chaperone protein dnaJ 20, chloroplastic-like [Phoenix dactylifera]|uniref:Chaperone protein dnaJ 20, chloroplastic-like n=1 Tax=Phoenix dactylifera TaxID=42345 RepID=A0A8B7D3E0_PHODC|nr:chaperone protein dnaJ 20, chloroplastic-like [Phoenix dactylifera]
MSFGVVVPGSSSRALHPCPNHLQAHLPATRIGGDGGAWRVALRRRERGWAAGLSSSSSFSSSFRTLAAVEEGGFVGAKGSLYELLGISEGGSYDEIKKAYKQLARKYHPDVSPPDRTEEYTRRFIEVQEAYETLSDPGRRALYDCDLCRGFHLAFSTRKRLDEELDERSGWRNRWQDQIAELGRRSMNKDAEDNLSWGAQMRRRRAESSIE